MFKSMTGYKPSGKQANKSVVDFYNITENC